MVAPSTGGSQDDIVFQAWVEDLTEKFFNNFDNRLGSLENRVSSGFDQVDSTVKRSANVMGLLGGVVGGLTVKVVDFALQGVAAFNRFAQGSIQMRARADVLAQSLEIVGNNAGYSDEQLKKFEEDLKGAGITTIEARQSLSRMAQANLDLTKSADLARTAQNAAAIAGVNSSEAFNRVLHGITTLQPEILRGLNLTISMEQEIEKWARANNRNASSISYQEKQMIALNATIKAGEKLAGVYESSMGLVGKQVTSLPRYMEELQLAIGEVFQPAYTAAVFNWGDALKASKQWIDDNHDAIVQLGEAAGGAVTVLVETMQSAVSYLSKIPELITNVGIDVAKIIGNLTGTVSPEEIEARRSKLGEYFRQAVSLLVGFVNAGIAAIRTAIDFSLSGLKSLVLTLQGDIEGAARVTIEAQENMANLGQVVQDAFNEGVVATAEFTGLIEDAGEAASDAGYEFDKAADDALKLADALADANSRIMELARALEDEMMEVAIKETRRAIESELRLSWRLEDMARGHSERIAHIIESGQDARADAVQRYADARIDIERDYQRRLRDIQRNFDYEAEELARNRDAIGLLRLMRSNKKQLEDERISKHDRVEDTKRAEKESLEAVEERIRKQLEAENEQYAKQQENMERELEREREIRALHTQWEQEDRDRKHAKQLADLMQQLQTIQGITDEGLNELLGQWGGYFGDLLTMAYERMDAIARIIDPNAIQQSLIGPGGVSGPRIQYPTTYGPSVTGQGGQVSQILGGDVFNMGSMRMPSVPSVPPTSSGGQRKEIVIKADMAGVEPYVQRQVVRALYEIERNNRG